MRLVIAEKPSVARDLAKVLGAHKKQRTYLEGPDIRITWCFGHMCELAEPASYNTAWKKWNLDALPMIPEHFDINVRKDTKEHWSAIAALLKDDRTTEIVNACDAGREGELIFRYLVQSAEVSKPTLRLWVSSMTTEAIKKAWANLQPGQNYDNLAAAARCRSEADWLVGFNATRAMTCMVQKTTRTRTLSIGRVQTPTLAMIVHRDKDIDNFVPEIFWRVEGQFSPVSEPSENDLIWRAKWLRYDPNQKKVTKKSKGKNSKKEEAESPHAERLSSAEEAQLIAEAAKGKAGILIESTQKQVKEKAPLLYDLNSLQRRANQRYGFSAQQTLNIAQSLYETHKLITYPRTDARYLLPDQKSGMGEVLTGLQAVEPYRDHIEKLLSAPSLREDKRIYNAKEVGDHHAIIPTGKSPLRASLNPDEKRIFDMVARRLLGALSPDAKFASSLLIVSVDTGEAILPPEIVAPLYFQAKGNVCLDPGWQVIDPPPPKSENRLPKLEKNQVVYTIDTSVHEGHTRPPRQFNEASLLGAMESAGKNLQDAELKRAMRNAGLGTPATRASTIETLISRQFIERQKRNIISTELGKSLIGAITVEELKSAELTGRWEARLSAISEGSDTRESFMNDVRANLSNIIESIKSTPPPSVPTFVEENPEESLGACPKCSTPVRPRRSVYTCDTGRGCEFVIFNTIASRKISKRMVKQLLNQGFTSHVKGFKSKNSGKTFEAALKLDGSGKVVFDFSQSQNQKKKPQLGIGMNCPNCKDGYVIQGARQYGCDQWKSGCTFTLSISSPVGMLCPACQIGRIIKGRTAWGCHRFKEGCKYHLLFKKEDAELSDTDAVKLLLAARKSANE